MFGKQIFNVIYYSFSIAFICTTTVFSIFYYYGKDLPSELTLLEYTPITTSRIYDNDGNLIEEYSQERRTVLSFDEIPILVKGAFLIAEDRDFYEHGGVSLQGFMRAVIENTARKVWNKKPTGGSTITQQVAKNLLVGTERSMRRKIREAIMAFRIESSLSKNKIFEIYLNQLYLGKGCYGVASACEYYFNKNIKEATPAEVALIASLPSIPNIYIHHLDSKKLQIKKNSILYQLYDMGYITEQQLKEAIKTPIKINNRTHKNKYQYYTDEVFRIISQRISKEAFFKSGFSITTTMDATVQYIAVKALEDGLIEYTKRYKWKQLHFTDTDLAKIQEKLPSTINEIIPCKALEINKDNITAIDKDNNIINVQLSKNFYTEASIHKGNIILVRKVNDYYELYVQPEVTGGIVVMDASTGNILAMSGGYSFDISSFNCITQSLRQPGSAIKPFVYALALEAGASEHDIISDEPIHIKFPDGRIYSPKNYNNKYLVEIELRDALIQSKNVATVRLAQIIGMRKINSMFINLELTEKRFPISAVLGAIDTSPIKLLSAFSIFVNKGKMVRPRFIKNISQFNKHYVSENLTADLTKITLKQIVSSETADTMRRILHDVVTSGTASRLASLEEQFGIEVIGKTGSTNDWKDAWFIGAVTKHGKTLIVCVFVGYPKPKTLGNKMYGSVVAMPIFKSFISDLFLYDDLALTEQIETNLAPLDTSVIASYDVN